MTDRLHIDIETYSECDLKKSGLYRYAEDPSTEILVLCYAFNDGPVHVWVPRAAIPAIVRNGILERMDEGAEFWCGELAPLALIEWIEAGKQVRAHNAQFERTVLNGVAGQKLGFPKLKIGQMVCTAAKAAAAALPRDLDSAAKARGTYPKKAVGKNDMLACAKPRQKESEPRWTPENDPDRFVRLYDYCIDDVKAERDLDANTPDLSENEQAVWEMDQRINDRGVAVDLEAIANIKALIVARKNELAIRCRNVTKPAALAERARLVAELASQGKTRPKALRAKVEGYNPSQTGEIADWIRGNGYPQLPNLQADTVNAAQLDPNCPPLVREMLLIYSAHNMKAVSKYDAILRSVCKDGRIRGMFMYYGANTGRWSSLIVQLQNLYRPVIKDCDTAIEATASRDLDWIKFLYPSTEPMKVFASCIRGMFVAGPGKKFVSLDYAGIESRFTARMFAEWWKVKAFELFDKGEGPDSYRLAYARAFQIHVDKVDQHMRQIGKVLELAFGFEGGVGACITAAGTYGVDLDALTEAVWYTIPADVMDKSEWMWDKFGKGSGLNKRTYLGLNSLKEMWRIAHPRHVQGWRDMKDAAIAAIENPGKAYSIPSKWIMFKVEEDWLLMRLPSGRRIRYYKPEVEYDYIDCGENCEGGTCKACAGTGKIRNPRSARITYLGIDTDTRRWMRTGTYGGKLTENGAQGGSSDLLRHGVMALERERYWPVMTVHDEVVCEVDLGFGSLEEATRVFVDKPAWADRLPIAAEGWAGKRYRKE